MKKRQMKKLNDLVTSQKGTKDSFLDNSKWNKWFYNITDYGIPKNVECCLALCDRFNLPYEVQPFPLIIYWYRIYCPKRNYLTRAKKTTMKYLKELPNILVMKADKGNTTVLLIKQDYFDKANILLYDRSTYTCYDLTLL